MMIKVKAIMCIKEELGVYAKARQTINIWIGISSLLALALLSFDQDGRINRFNIYYSTSLERAGSMGG